MAAGLASIGPVLAQDLGPRVQKLADGVYVHTGKGFESNSGIIITSEGVVVIDTGQNAIESHSKSVHSEADTAVWLPKERVLFSASAFVAGQMSRVRSISSAPSSILPISSPPGK
ncbi:MAG: hypothetical protein EXR28_05700 [Betaproteobacteria bacterium]|nr:hypothetical protein [Betaproteobacteria bacterium]